MKIELGTRALLNVKEMCEYLGIGQLVTESNPLKTRTRRFLKMEI